MVEECIVRFIVFGSRDWNDEAAIRKRLLEVPRDWVLVEGEAPGVDSIAKKIWTELAGADKVESFPPLGAGPKYKLERNCRMASQPGVRLAIGFRKRGVSRGTDHMWLVACPFFEVPVEMHYG